MGEETRAAVRAVSELTGSPIEEDLNSDPQPGRE